MEDNYVAPELAAEEKRYKYSLWWVGNRSRLAKLGLIFWAGINVLLILFALWVMVDTYLIDYQDERALLVMMGLNQDERHDNTVATTPESLKVDTSAEIFSLGDSRYDFYSELENSNENYWVEFDYYFTYGSSQTEVRKGYAYPSESKPLVELAWNSDNRPTSAKTVVENLQWHFLDPHTIPDFVEFEEERMSFSIYDTDFDPSLDTETGDTITQSVFTVRNSTAYSYWEPVFYTILYRSSSVVGITKTTLNKFEAGETRTVEQNWYGTIPSVTEIEVVPEIAILDLSVYMPLTGETQEDLRERVYR
jgi:hypothetical protein